jgi:hypothetical protein
MRATITSNTRKGPGHNILKTRRIVVNFVYDIAVPVSRGAAAIV